MNLWASILKSWRQAADISLDDNQEERSAINAFLPDGHIPSLFHLNC